MANCKTCIKLDCICLTCISNDNCRCLSANINYNESNWVCNMTTKKYIKVVNMCSSYKKDWIRALKYG